MRDGNNISHIYIENENNKASFSNNNHIQEKFKPFEDKPSPEALKNVMSFLMKYENAIGTSGYREIYFEKLNIKHLRCLCNFNKKMKKKFFLDFLILTTNKRTQLKKNYIY